MFHNYRGAIVVAAYLVFGAAWLPAELYLAPPNVQNVTFKECHKGCKPGTGVGFGNPCIAATVCSTTTTKRGETNAAPPGGGSTGPAKPAPPKTGGTSKHQ
jgi:hypothetical protein